MRNKLFAGIVSTLMFAGIAFANTTDRKEAVSELNDVLKGEISAIETYQQALKKIDGQSEASTLKSALSNHQDAADKLSKEIAKLGGKPTEDSGAWGLWAQTVMGSAKVIGDTAALKALKEGEEHGVKEYRELLENKNVPQDVKSVVKETFIPRQLEHIAKIDTMIAQNS